MKIFAISGLGADKRVFDFLTLDHELVHVDWIAPEHKETIEVYSKRLISLYGIGEETEFGILGVSFGGLVGIEISKLTKPKLTIIVSSVETKDELSGVVKLAGKTGILKLVPKWMLKPPKAIVSFMFGTKRKKLVGAILDDTDLTFVKWALGEFTTWDNETRLKNLLKIGGTKDKMLSPKGDNTILIHGGGHFMIVDRADEISKIINEALK